MKIGIEAQRIFRTNKHGMDMVAVELIRNLQKLDKQNEYVIFVSPDNDNQIIQETDNFKIVEIPGKFYPYWEQILLPKYAVREKCDLLHCTSNTGPLYCSIPIIDILHDIIYMEKNFFQILNGTGTAYQKFGNIYRRVVVPRLMKKSIRITTVSNFERKRIQQFFQLKEEQIIAIYNGVSTHFRPITETTELNRIKNKYNLPDRFFFFFGNTDPKKNTKRTIQAFIRYIEENKSPEYLVMPDYNQSELKKILAELNQFDLLNRIKLTGYIKNTDLPGIYSQCELFLYPSLRESFGIPMLEAMACGIPVITSNTSSMPEVAGKGALFIDPYQPEAITKAIKQLQASPRLRQELITEGLERVKQFTWEKMAKQMLELYYNIEQEKLN